MDLLFFSLIIRTIFIILYSIQSFNDYLIASIDDNTWFAALIAATMTLSSYIIPISAMLFSLWQSIDTQVQ